MKKYFIVAFTLSLTVGIYAFAKPTTHKTPPTLFWYEFIDLPGNDPDDPMDYQRTSNQGQDEPSCSPGDKRCAVQAEPASSTDLTHPDLTTAEVIKTKQ